MMNIKLYPFLRTVLSLLLPKKIIYRPGSGGTYSSEYCYSVWLRHLHYLIANKLFNSVTEIAKIAEIGPGDSLGIGISALYTGASEYYAFDEIKHASSNNNKKINDQLVQYFISKADIPNTDRQKYTSPSLLDYSFPLNYLSFTTDFYKKRRFEIEKALDKNPYGNVKIQYVAPWMNVNGMDIGQIDLIISQAVMEHIDDIEFAYSEMFKWLRPGGVISHQVDFKAHEMTKEWNGHWFIKPKIWKFLLKGRKYSINRLPLSTHIKILEKIGFSIKFIKPVTMNNAFKDCKLQVPGINFTDEDLITSSALIQAVKPI